jgi:hypothetical protein
VKKTLDIRNFDFTICDMVIQSQSLNQVHIWTVGSSPSQSFIDCDLECRNDSSPDSRDARSRFNQGPLDQEDMWQKIIISLTGKSKESRDARLRKYQDHRIIKNVDR